MITKELTEQLSLPAVCAPMFLVTGPELVAAASCAGLLAGLPRANARSLEEFRQWLVLINEARSAFAAEHPGAPIGPVAVNLPKAVMGDTLDENLAVCREQGVEIIISAQGDPTRLVERVHGWGGIVFHDATTLRFAEKAAAVGADGITCIGYGGGGHSGLENAQIMVSRIREFFDGLIILGGGISNGQGIRAAEAVGADLAYLGTRFIASDESMAPAAYKEMIVRSDIVDLKYAVVSGRAPANWLVPSLLRHGITTDELADIPLGGRITLPDGVHPWSDVWSAGQGISLINEVAPVRKIVDQLVTEYHSASSALTMASSLR